MRTWVEPGIVRQHLHRIDRHRGIGTTPSGAGPRQHLSKKTNSNLQRRLQLLRKSRRSGADRGHGPLVLPQGGCLIRFSDPNAKCTSPYSTPLNPATAANGPNIGPGLACARSKWARICSRGHRFCRYADDCNIYVRSRRAGERVMASVGRFLTNKLRLKVNEAKSAVRGRRKKSFSPTA